MSSIPKNLEYSRSHEWVKRDEEGVTVGITDHAQGMLGDLVYVELPEVEMSYENGQECALVESVKAAADIYCPLAGEVLEINQAVMENPQLINEDPYGKGWLFRLKPFENEASDLLKHADYSKLVASEAH